MDTQYVAANFYVLTTDVTSKDLHEGISAKLEKPYLSSCEDDNIDMAHGIIWGENNRIFVAMVVRMEQQKKYVPFLVDTGSPHTYISEEVFASFGQLAINPSTTIRLHINGKPWLVLQSPKSSHFKDVNVLGTTFMKHFASALKIDFRTGSVSLTSSLS